MRVNFEYGREYSVYVQHNSVDYCIDATDLMWPTFSYEIIYEASYCAFVLARLRHWLRPKHVIRNGFDASALLHSRNIHTFLDRRICMPNWWFFWTSKGSRVNNATMETKEIAKDDSDEELCLCVYEFCMLFLLWYLNLYVFSLNSICLCVVEYSKLGTFCNCMLWQTINDKKKESEMRREKRKKNYLKEWPHHSTMHTTVPPECVSEAFSYRSIEEMARSHFSLISRTPI